MRIDLRWLGRQREMLGDNPFRAILADQLTPDDVSALLSLLDSAAGGDSVGMSDSG